MQQHVSASSKNVFMTAHTLSVLDEQEMVMKTKVPIKGALKNNGIESYFGTVISTKKKTIKDLEPYKSEYLNISDEDELVGYKHVFQTKITKETTGESIRSPLGLFSVKETYIDNDINHVIKKLHEFFD